MKKIKDTAFVTNTDGKVFVDNINQWILKFQKMGFEVELQYASTTPFNAKTEYQAFIVARGE